MYTLKTIARRGTALGMAASLLVATILPASAAFADALNPLTERSLLLSSSAPGYMDTDGSGNSAVSPNSVGENYAPAGSGPNGKKTGETFTFTHTSTATVKGLSFQYCTSAAGVCQSPGNNGELVPGYTGDADDPGDARNGVYDPTAGSPNTTGRPDNVSPDPLHPEYGGHDNQKSDLDFVGTFTEGTGAGQFSVTVDGSPSTGWAFTKANLEDDAHTGTLTGKNNYVTLTNSTGEAISSGDEVVVTFRPSETIYITNPGSREFFVKINTYNSDTDLFGPQNIDGVNNVDEDDFTIIDGGVTVANVMTDSIHITTKVLETMSFSVGTQNRDTVDIGSGELHGKCDPILTPNNNRLNLGNPNAEYSLETGKAWDVYSYWRLSSNSSGGATVYYSGDTLRNTVGDHIQDMPSEVTSTPGTEQFGLGFVDAHLLTTANPATPWLDVKDNGAATWASGWTDPDSYPFRTLSSQIGATPYNNDPLAPQGASNNYDEAEGTIDNGSGGPGTAKFRFLASSLTSPELIAQQNETVISCATAKMRYVGNIGADTPAGVYTTKINYLAAPQY